MGQVPATLGLLAEQRQAKIRRAMGVMAGFTKTMSLVGAEFPSSQCIRHKHMGITRL